MVENADFTWEYGPRTRLANYIYHPITTALEGKNVFCKWQFLYALIAQNVGLAS